MKTVNYDAVATIYQQIEEAGAKTLILKMLIDDMERANDNLNKQLACSQACLRAIKKINNGKVEAIEALCEGDVCEK